MGIGFTTFKLGLAKILLGPLLLWQGHKVRRNTPVLPEPVGQKTGQQGQGRTLRLLVLGDSSAAGVGAPTAKQSLLGQLLEQLSEDYQVTYQLLAATGKTTADVLAEIPAQPQQHFDVVVTALGVNDVTAQVALRRWRRQQARLIDLIHRQFTPQLIIMSGLPPVRDFPALLWPLNLYLGACADAKDQLLQALLARHDSVHFLSLRGYPEQAKAAVDGFHPGPMVYQLWAQNIAQLINKKWSQ